MVSTWVLTGEAYLGKGSFGRVYRASICGTNQVLAVKKTRASRTLINTQLNHERLILQRLQGHASIPTVFAYGRADQFEYLAIELLGDSLSDISKRCGPLPDLNIFVIAEQMMSALQHIHNHKLVHGDIKPGNILTDQTSPHRLVLVDYGITRSICRNFEPVAVKPMKMHVVPGTLAYASIHLHQGSGPAPRDDIESLGYTLLDLGAGILPWSYCASHGPRKIRQDQVLRKKRQYSGSHLAPHGLPFVADIIDYARNTTSRESLDYTWLQAQLSFAQQLPGLDTRWPMTWAVPPKPLPDNLTAYPKPAPTECPVTPGQIVCCQIDLRTSLEGFSARAGNPDFHHDPDLTRMRWGTKIRPAVILRTELRSQGIWMVWVACIGRGDPGVLGNKVSFVQITCTPTEGSIVPSPTWRVPNSYCYAYMYPTLFYCYPGEVDIVPSTWTIGETDLQYLSKKMINPSFTRQHYFHQVFVRITTLGAEEGDNIDWEGGEAWHHELLQVNRMHREYDLCGTELKSPRLTYYGWDYEQWSNPQHELSASIAADVDNVPGSAGFPSLPKIMNLELSDEIIYEGF